MRSICNILVTGGAGFIGSCFIRYLLSGEFSGKIVNYDLLTYAGNLEYLNGFSNHPRYRFIQGDILNQDLIEKILIEYEIDTIVHFAAETHVDRSIQSAKPFIDTNIYGTLSLLEAVKKFPHIHFHHVSTDEVFGSLGEAGKFHENSLYRPSSPYSASKASSDHLVKSFAYTYGLSITMSHSSNNYGPCQNSEKLIPLMIQNSLQHLPLPIYGKGANVRDWLYVDDHVKAIWMILKNGSRGSSFGIGGGSEFSNLELVNLLIDILNEIRPFEYRSLIRFVEDRKGHDFRYAIDHSKISKELGWYPQISVRNGLEKTISWYIQRYREALKE